VVARCGDASVSRLGGFEVAKYVAE